MKFEFLDLRTYLANGNNVQLYDYIYKHSLSGYPLRKDFDAADYYLVTGYDIKTGVIEVLQMGGSVKNSTTTFNVNLLLGYWWILPLPHYIKNQIFPPLP